MNGPKILFYIPLFGGLPVTETLVNSWIVMAFLILVSLWLTHGMKKNHISKRQVIVETGVKMLYQLVGDTMGEDKLYFTPYIGTLFLFTLCANLMGLFTFRSPTADLNTTAAFAVIFFGLVQVFSIKANGLKNRIKGFAEPVPVVLPLNIVGEFSTPVALALPSVRQHGFRHRGNFPCCIRRLPGYPTWYSARSHLSRCSLWVSPRSCPFTSTCLQVVCKHSSSAC